ncbi:putative uncharacterized protein FLJ46214 [Aphelocoma coerulescens]|uniref:putative uncharacterized protein FLJ46214 n=1 Tax=Aphelocoma coerulescens TaxID=39617 RepID=UPI0036045CEB
MGCAAGRAEGPAVSITAPGAGRREGKSRAESSRARRHATDVRHREKRLLFSSSSHAPRGWGQPSRLGGRGDLQSEPPQQAGSGHVRVRCGRRYCRPLRSDGTLPSPGPPNSQSTRQSSSISFAKKSGENGQQRARRQANSCPAQRESPLRRQHLHGPSGQGAAPGSRPCPGEDEALLTARYRPLGAPRRSPGPSFASARGKATRPPRRLRPGPGTSSSPGPRPDAGPSGRVAAPRSRGNAPTGRAEPRGAPVATVAMGVA